MLIQLQEVQILKHELLTYCKDTRELLPFKKCIAPKMGPEVFKAASIKITTAFSFSKIKPQILLYGKTSDPKENFKICH